jgi:hypothetical protein
MIIKERFPWYMGVVGAVGAIGLVTGVGTLTRAFDPMFGAWAIGAAVLIDMLALALTVWAIQAVRSGVSAGLVRSSAHVCITVSVAAQAVTSFQGLSGTVGGWTSAVMHTIPPLVLGLALELIYRHYADQWRAKVAPAVAAETMREQLANAAVGRPVQLGKVQRAVVQAAIANVLDMRALAGQLAEEDLTNIPAMRTLHAVVDPQGAAELETRRRERLALDAAQSSAHLSAHPNGFELSGAPQGQGLWGPDQSSDQSVQSSDQSVQSSARSDQSSALDDDDVLDGRSIGQAERRARVRDLSAKGLTTREISRVLGCSPSTVSNDLKHPRDLREVI